MTPAEAAHHHQELDPAPLRTIPSDRVTSKFPSDSLISRTLDVWLIGGASLLAWAFLIFADQFRENRAISTQLSNIVTFAASMALFVNYPHFMASYKIAYGRGWRFVKANWFQLILVPFSLIALFGYSYLIYSEPSPLEAKWNPLNMRAGEGMVSLLVLLMFMTVGWHYIKQTFGCMMVYGAFDGYGLSKGQRRILLTFLYMVAFLNFIAAHIGSPAKTSFYGVPTFTLGLPVELHALNQAIFVCFSVAFLYFIIWRKWKSENKLPTLHFLVPLLALIVWWIPGFSTREFFYIVPLFHSLQYLPFAYRYEASRNSHQNRRAGTGALQIIFLVLVGFVAFEFVPYLLTDRSTSPDIQKSLFFVVAFHVFINIHHYFIDNTIWKFHQPEVQRYLLNRHLDA